MRIDRPDVTFEIDFDLEVGEGPVWDASSGALWFVDILAPALLRLDTAGKGLRRFRMPSAIGSFALAIDRRILVALRDGVYWFDPETEAMSLLARPEPDRPENRLNDGKVGPDGCFYVGSMDDRPTKAPIAALYRIDPAGGVALIADGLIVSNGLAWSLDGRTMYHSDSRGAYVQAFDFDPAHGVVSLPRRLCQLTDADGRPDGAATDAEGYYWSAGVTAGVLNRIAPDGRIERKIELPVAAPTMPCFGGPDLKTLYVTSLTREAGHGRLAGTLLSFPIDVPGVPVPRFGARRPNTRLT